MTNVDFSDSNVSGDVILWLLLKKGGGGKEKAGYSSSHVLNNRVRKQLTRVDYS